MTIFEVTNSLLIVCRRNITACKGPHSKKKKTQSFRSRIPSFKLLKKLMHESFKTFTPCGNFFRGKKPCRDYGSFLLHVYTTQYGARIEVWHAVRTISRHKDLIPAVFASAWPVWLRPLFGICSVKSTVVGRRKVHVWPKWPAANKIDLFVASYDECFEKWAMILIPSKLL